MPPLQPQRVADARKHAGPAIDLPNLIYGVNVETSGTKRKASPSNTPPPSKTVKVDHDPRVQAARRKQLLQDRIAAEKADLEARDASRSQVDGLLALPAKPGNTAAAPAPASASAPTSVAADTTAQKLPASPPISQMAGGAIDMAPQPRQRSAAERDA